MRSRWNAEALGRYGATLQRYGAIVLQTTALLDSLASRRAELLVVEGKLLVENVNDKHNTKDSILRAR